MKIGVIVGRFQTPVLHSGHYALLSKALKESDYLLIFIGVSAISGNKRNPMDYVTRMQMVYDAAHNHGNGKLFEIYPIEDYEDDVVWSKNLDFNIKKSMKFGDTVTLFGGDDSFLDCYQGQYINNIQRLNTTPRESATVMRRNVVQAIPGETQDFREGVIYAIGNMRDTVSATADMACFNPTGTYVLIGRKANEKLWRFPGGFVDATDRSIEMTARRELSEETGVNIEGDVTYVGSRIVDDWRFRNSPDKAIMTTLFAGRNTFGKPDAKDDLAEVRWVAFEKESLANMNPGHRALFEMLLDAKDELIEKGVCNATL